MKFRLANILFFLFFAISTSIYGQDFKAFADDDIPEKPNPARLVNDYTNTLNSGQVANLEQKLRGYMDTTSTQIVVVFVSTTGDYAIDDYAIRLGRKWEVGQEKKNNGVVLLVAKDDRKIDIQTGYGTEGYISHIDAKNIITTYLTPNFREGRFYEGIDAATNQMITLLEGGFTQDPKSEEGFSTLFMFILLLLILFFILYVAKKSKNNGNHTYDGRGWHTNTWDTPTWTGRGGSGGWFGGGSSGGGGGGFDFGGGSFGGGGASGDW